MTMLNNQSEASAHTEIRELAANALDAMAGRAAQVEREGMS